MRKVAWLAVGLCGTLLVACSSDGEGDSSSGATGGASGAAAGAAGANAGSGGEGASGGSAGTSGSGGGGGSGGSAGVSGWPGTGGSAGAAAGAAGAGAGGGTCDPGHLDCDADPSNGCETDALNDPNHCGNCATACPTVDHGFPTCSGGICGFTCVPTHDDCNADPSDGCEVVLGSDLQNCGTCGNVCTAGPGETPMCAGGVCDICPSIQFSIDTKQACAISVLPGFTLDAEAFIQVGGTDHRVLAMDRWGDGHVIAWCDSTTTYALLNAFDALGYLGQTQTPKVASFGDTYLCTPGNGISNLPASITYLGTDLPASYQGNAAQLAADYDVLLFCGFRIPWSYDWSAEIEAFVTVHGKGFLAAMDYEGVVQQTDFQNMTKITDGAGIVFEPLNLPWAPASTNVVLDCVPDVEG